MFFDRKEAGIQLATRLKSVISGLEPKNSIILGLPRGGTIVAAEISKVLKIPLDIIIVRKIGYPKNPEYAIGAVGESGRVVLSEVGSEISPKYLTEQIKKEKQEIKRRLKAYRRGREERILKNKTIILIDDGLATGFSMKAAIKEIKTKKPSKIIVAVPVAPKEAIDEIKQEVDQVVCLKAPTPFFAIGNHYINFKQVSDKEVEESLRD